jgi:hypothetical protein
VGLTGFALAVAAGCAPPCAWLPCAQALQGCNASAASKPVAARVFDACMPVPRQMFRSATTFKRL